MAESIELAHTPPGLALYVTCYTGVHNAAALREQLLAGNTEYEYAFVDASVVGSLTKPLRLQGSV